MTAMIHFVMAGYQLMHMGRTCQCCSLRKGCVRYCLRQRDSINYIILCILVCLHNYTMYWMTN